MEQFFLIPIIIVIASGLIYVFGFKKAQEPKFKKIAESSSGSSNRSSSLKATNTNRKKEKSVSQNSEKKSEKIKADSNNKKKPSEPVVQKQDQQTVSQSVKKTVESTKSATKSAATKSSKDKSKTKNADKTKLNANTADQPKVQNDDEGWFEVVNKRNKKNDESKNDKVKEKQQVSPSKSPVKGQKKDDKSQKSKQTTGKSPKKVNTDSKIVKAVVQNNSAPKSETPVIIEVVESASQAADYDKENQSQNNQTSVKVNNVEQAPASTPVHQKAEVAETVETVSETKTSSGIVFDELGDSWTEAKAPKKSKKKVRKD